MPAQSAPFYSLRQNQLSIRVVRNDSAILSLCNRHQSASAGASCRFECAYRTGGAVGGDGSFIIMEHLKFGRGSDQAALGKQLARMHLAEVKVELLAEFSFWFSPT